MDARGDPRTTSLARPVIESISGLMAALADPTRIAMLDTLRGGGANVQQLADELDLPHRNASHHALVLHRAGILRRRREGREVVYAVEDWAAWWLIGQAAGIYAEDDR
jgi:DNA-binding transcriptional ArsR family regulator